MSDVGFAAGTRGRRRSVSSPLGVLARHAQDDHYHCNLEPGNPNLDAGAGGATLGAFGLAEPLPDR